MTRIKNLLSKSINFTHLISIGFFAKAVPKEKIDAVLERLGKQSKRVRLFPACAVVYFLMAMSIFREASTDEVLRIFAETARRLSRDEVVLPTPTPSAISQARNRLGSEAMRLIADEVLRPIAGPDAPEAWYKGFKLIAVDGSCFDVPDEAKNATFFGYPSGSRGEIAFPQARVLSLVETGSLAVIAAEIGGSKVSEIAMATSLFEKGKLLPGMLLLADRGFFGYPLWSKAVATGANLLWRAKVGLKLPKVEYLPDGSYISLLKNSRDKEAAPIRIRVIEYILHDLNRPDKSNKIGEKQYRIATNIFDHELAPAKELANLYHERWEIENMYGEFQKILKGGYSTVIRSKTPDLVLQELWGILLVHFAIRSLMAEAAWRVEIDPDKLSFKHAVSIVRRKIPRAAAPPPSQW
jgi:hypothetical protein